MKIIKKITFFKEAFRTAIAVFFSLLISHFFAFSEIFWMPLATLLVMQTPPGSTVHHGIQRGLIMMLSVATGSFLMLAVHSKILLETMMIFAFSGACCWSLLKIKRNTHLSLEFIAVLILLITTISPVLHLAMIYDRVCDVTVGALIGIGINLLIAPVYPDVEFRREIILILRAYSDYLQAIADLLLMRPDAKKNATEKKIKVENILQQQFPVWVHEMGFNIALRQGHRHFVVMIERMGQLLFSMHRAARNPIDADTRNQITEPLEKCVHHIRKVLNNMVLILELQQPETDNEDFSENIIQLEKAFRSGAVPTLELLDLSRDYGYFASFIQDIKDLYLTLWKLLEALR